MEYYFKFSFMSMHTNNKNLSYHVLAETKENLYLFLKQHGFSDAPPESIQLFPKDKVSADLSHILKPFKFKSNKMPGVFSVMTCEAFVDTAIDNLAADLNANMLFGEAIIRRDVEVFKMIGDLVHDLPFAHVIDFVLADVESSNFPDASTVEDIRQMTDEYRTKICCPCEDTDYYMTYEQLHDAVNPDEIYPITLECYISNFTEMMVDVFD